MANVQHSVQKQSVPQSVPRCLHGTRGLRLSGQTRGVLARLDLDHLQPPMQVLRSVCTCNLASVRQLQQVDAQLSAVKQLSLLLTAATHCCHDMDMNDKPINLRSSSSSLESYTGAI
jgi:hypothetical protein